MRCTICDSEFEAAHEGGDRPSRTAYAVALFYLCVACRAEWQTSGEYRRAALATDAPLNPIIIGAVALEDFIRRRVAERRNGCAT